MFLPPVILVAITTLDLSTFRLCIHLPMHNSVSPSCTPRPSEGIGYCSAVSIRLTPCFRIALSMNSKHVASSGALKSDDTQRWVPRPSSDTTISDPPSRLCLIPFTFLTISFVAPLEPEGVGLALAEGSPPKNPPKKDAKQRSLLQGESTIVRQSSPDLVADWWNAPQEERSSRNIFIFVSLVLSDSNNTTPQSVTCNNYTTP